MTNAQNYIFHEGGLYWVESFDKLSIEERQLVTWSVEEVLVCLIDGISNIVVEWDNLNTSSDLETPPCLPHELVRLSGHDFAELLQSQQRRIVTTFNEQGLDGLQDEFCELVCMYQRNGTIRAGLDTYTSKDSFVGEARNLETQFQKKMPWFSRFESVILITNTLETDFSVNEWKKINIELLSLIFHWKVFSNANNMKCLQMYSKNLKRYLMRENSNTLR